MPTLLTPPFPIAGFGVVLVELLLSAVLVAVFWTSYPRGFAHVGALLAALLLACWFLAGSIGARVLANPKYGNRAKVALRIAAALGCWSLVLGLLTGPHLAELCVWGVLGQLGVLAIGRVACAV